MYNYFTHASNHVSSRQLMYMKIYDLSYILIDVKTHNWMYV